MSCQLICIIISNIYMYIYTYISEEWFYNHRIIVLGTGFVVQQSMAGKRK